MKQAGPRVGRRARCVALLLALVPVLAPGLAATGERVAGSDVDFTSAHTTARTRERRALRDVAAAAQAQVIAGKLAARRGGAPEVRAFGKKLASSRQRTVRRLSLLSLQTQVPLPSRPGKLDDTRIARLRSLQGNAFDLAFLEQFGVGLQERERALYRSPLSQAADRGVRKFAQQADRAMAAPLDAARTLLAQAQASATGEDAPSAPAGAAASPASVQRAVSRLGEPWDAEERDAMQGILQAAAVLRRMKEDRRMDALLADARGVLVFTHYRRGGLLVGVRSGAGVLVTRHGAAVSAPVFYRLQGVSIGLQAGAAAGAVVYLLMSDASVQQFRSTREFSIDAFLAGTLGADAHQWHSSAGKLKDLIAWSGTHGAYGGLAAGGTRIVPDEDANRAYYGRAVSASQILGGLVQNPHAPVLASLVGP